MRVSPLLRSRALTFRPLPRLPDGSLATFREQAFTAEAPHLFPRGAFSSLPAIGSWFAHPSASPSSTTGTAYTILRPSALEPFSSALVTTELTMDGTFQRHEAPLGMWLAWAVAACNPETSNKALSGAGAGRLTIAQTSLGALPAGMQAAVPTPAVIQGTGRGDVYDASLWMGVAPTVTPLHRDPNPNVLVQLAGRKRVRLLRPDVGQRVWRTVAAANHGLREGGEAMMHGTARAALESAVWTTPLMPFGDGAAEGGGERDAALNERTQHADTKGAWEGEIEAGDALFIPTGWWHAVHGVGEGITASVNWWFR